MDYPQHVPLVADTDRYGTIDSDREYYVHEIDSTVVSEREYDRDDRDRKFRRFYEDSETGIVTRDVAKFEEWMRRVTPPAPTNSEEHKRGEDLTCADLGHEGSWVAGISCADPNAHSPFKRPVC